MSQDNIVREFMMLQNASGANTSGGFTGMTLGVVIDTDDPLQMGRLRVFCPSLNDDPKQLQYVPWSVYASPFAGSINNSSYTRGPGDVTPESKGALHYGFWAIPELGAHVLVACVDGDFRRRFWFACVPQHQETNTLHTGRWKWNGGTVEGPLTSADEPMEPLYTNAKQAFNDKKDSPEWKTRIADYQPTAIRDDTGQIPNNKKQTYRDQTNESIRKNEPDEWTHEALGAHGYDWSGFKNMGALLSSRTYGMSSPGMHMFVMDDRPFNNRIKIRTTSGHQILLDDTNERIYIATNKGNNWIEFDSNGNIDMFSEGHISISGSRDINISASDTIRMYAGRSISVYAGHQDLTDAESGELKVTERLAEGTIAMQAESDLMLISRNTRCYSDENTFIETGLNLFNKIGDSYILTSEKDVSVSTVYGDHIVSSGNSIYSTSATMTKHFSSGNMSIASDGDAEMQSFNGATSLSGSGTVRVKSANGNVDVEAGFSSGQGQVGIFAPNSQQVVGSNGISSVSTGNIATVSAAEVAAAVQPGFTLDNANALNTILASANINISKISGTNISISSAFGDLIQKTAQRGHSYNVLGDQIDKLTTSVNILTVQTGTMYSAIQTAISALGGSISIPFTFDIGCALSAIYAMLPQELLNAYATFQDLQQQLQQLGYAVDNLFDMIDALKNQNILDALGLPNLNIGFTLGATSCTPGMPLFSGTIDYNVPQLAIPENLRTLIKSIYDAGSQLGTAPALTELNWSK